jgi:hypothetical protein
MLRGPEYLHLVPTLCDSVEAGRASLEAIEGGTRLREPREASQWEQAWRLLPELRRRYQAAMGSIHL